MHPTSLTTGFDLSFVALSFVISAVGAFVALTASAGITAGRTISRINVLAAGLALGGIGIWAMHFIGMLALRVDMGIGYSMLETFVSLALAVAGTAFALLSVARRTGGVGDYVRAGFVLGLAVCAMHYLGMYGMRFDGFLQWNWLLVGASAAIAWVAASAALWLAFAVRTLPARAGASIVMAAAVCAMHYTGMAAADFICTSATPRAFPTGAGVVSSTDLPLLVTFVALGMAFVISVDQIFQRVNRSAARAARPLRTAR